MADSVSNPPGAAPIGNHQPTPPGVLPRRAQVWLMLAIAAGIMLVILFTGHDPARPVRAATPPATPLSALVPNPDQLRLYGEQLEGAARRLSSTRPAAPPA